MELAIPDSYTTPADDEAGTGYACEACGHQHQRITKIIDACVPKPALVKWAYNCGRDGIDIDKAKEEGGDRGSALHDFLAAYIDTGNLPSLESLRPEHQPYGQQLSKFIVDYEPEFLASEVLVAHHDLDYAGRLDGFAIIHKQPAKRNKPWDLTGKTVLFDLKTSRDGRVYAPAHYLQVSGYSLAWKAMGGQTIDNEVIVAVGESKYQLAVNYMDPFAFPFLADYYGMLQKQKALNPNGRK